MRSENAMLLSWTVSRESVIYSFLQLLYIFWLAITFTERWMHISWKKIKSCCQLWKLDLTGWGTILNRKNMKSRLSKSESQQIALHALSLSCIPTCAGIENGWKIHFFHINCLYNCKLSFPFQLSLSCTHKHKKEKFYFFKGIIFCST